MKQLKIPKSFFRNAPKLPEDCEEIQEEIQQLELQLREKENELFQFQRNCYRQKNSPPKRNPGTFKRPQKIIINNSIDSLKRRLQLLSMLSGMKVESYKSNDHCCVIYHMQHDSEHEVKHGLLIDMKSGDNEISKCSLPLGFNLNAVMEDFDNVNTPQCHCAMKNALIAYYGRLEQFETLKNLIAEAHMFKVLDGSHMQISFSVRGALDLEGDHLDLVLVLDYRVYDIRPMDYSFKEIDLPEGAAEALKNQCAIFKKKPLADAFRIAFIDGTGPYMLVRRIRIGEDADEKPRKRFRPQHQDYRHDDTFRPEDCSDQGDDDYPD